MDIREASEADIPAIVSLLKISLGENLIPKSERYWRWKHLENPFGASPVLLCWEGDTLIGVRAFMRWEWNGKGITYRSLRAVDTATHPEHQGKGVFKKLTLSLAEHCTNQGNHFVFNTPNNQSRPGYLKMGWKQTGKLPVCINIKRPFHMMKNIIGGGGRHTINNDNNTLRHCLDHPGLADLLMECSNQGNKIITGLSPVYLRWRYLDVPVAQYVAISEEKENDLQGLIIGRIKETGLGRELRIAECFLKENNNGIALKMKLKKAIREWAIDYTTLSGAGQISKIFSGFQASVGPIVTVRSLSLKDMESFMNFNQWSPSLGDLELF